MSIGPVFALPIATISQLREVAATKGIRLETLDDCGQGAFPSLYMFCGRLGQIQGRCRTAGGACQIWLTFPRSHAFNPLTWPFDFYLSSRVQRMLGQLGARRIKWSSPDIS